MPRLDWWKHALHIEHSEAHIICEQKKDIIHGDTLIWNRKSLLMETCGNASDYNFRGAYGSHYTPIGIQFQGGSSYSMPMGFNFRGASAQTPVKVDIRGADNRMTMGFDSRGGSTFLYMLHVSIVSISDIFYSRRTGYFTQDVLHLMKMLRI